MGSPIIQVRINRLAGIAFKGILIFISDILIRTRKKNKAAEQDKVIMELVHAGQMSRNIVKNCISSRHFAIYQTGKKIIFNPTGRLKSIPDCLSAQKAALFINHYLNKFGTLCCIVPNIALSLTCH